MATFGGGGVTQTGYAGSATSGHLASLGTAAGVGHVNVGGVATKQLDLVLRSGPGDGLTLTAAVDLDADCLAVVHRTGYTYRDSGRTFKGRRIFDWLPSAG